ncbi:hypothetical protein Aph02nite_39550 [Actinoplanes philippinensis]|nr:hypothetical protein Aph02nite_39550 [Actinoplanes philippinensis]
MKPPPTPCTDHTNSSKFHREPLREPEVGTPAATRIETKAIRPMRQPWRHTTVRCCRPVVQAAGSRRAPTDEADETDEFAESTAAAGLRSLPAADRRLREQWVAHRGQPSHRYGGNGGDRLVVAAG